MVRRMRSVEAGAGLATCKALATWAARARRARASGLALGCAAGLMVACGPVLAAERVFTVGNYPVEARAVDAVAAKERAIADGQQAAFRSLLRRLVPVTAYQRLAAVRQLPAGHLIESFAVRSERNSSTDYIASYDFVFQAEPVRRLLDKEGIPYLDRQAPKVVLVPAYRVPPEAAGKLPQTFEASAGSDAWLYAWKALDLGNALTPLDVQPLKREVHGDTVNGLAQGDFGMLRTLGNEYGTQNVVVAVLEPDADLKRLKVVLVGHDAVQNLYLKRSYRLDGHDIAYTAELAAVISLAILEGRWKAVNVRADGGRQLASSASSASSWSSGQGPGGGPAPVARPSPGDGGPVGGGAVGGPVTISVQFRGMGEWQEISRQLAQTPEITGLDVLGLSARSARVSLDFPGGPERLALALAGQGLILQATPAGWVLQRR